MPALNASPVPVSTSTLTSGSVSSLVSASTMSNATCGLMALRLSGRLKVTQASKLYHMGIKARVLRSTLADANEVRDWRIHAEFAQSLIGIARPLYASEPFGVDLKETVYALDASSIDLCLSVFPWAPFRSTKAAIKLHTLLDLRGNIPTFLHISDGKLHDVNALDLLLPEPGAFLIQSP